MSFVPTSRTSTVRGRGLVAVALVAALALLPVGIVQAGATASAPTESATVSVPSTVTKLVKQKWADFCESDYCGAYSGVGTMPLPSSWTGEEVRLTATVAFDHRMRGVKRMRVGAAVGAQDVRAKQIRLTPKTWAVRSAGSARETSTLQFTKRVVVPTSAAVTLVPIVRAKAGIRPHRVSGKRFLWTVTATPVGGVSAAALASAGEQAVSRVVTGSRWSYACNFDNCNVSIGNGQLDLPAAWTGEQVRLTTTLTFNHRMRGLKRLSVGVYVANGLRQRTRLLPKNWRISRAGRGYDTTTVEFTRRVTIPANPTVYFEASGSRATREVFKANGTKALWTVTATA